MSDLAAALVAAQAALPRSIPREAEGQAGSRRYRYVTLDALLEAVRPVLAKHEIAVTQNVIQVSETRWSVDTRLWHSSGETETLGSVPLVDVSDMQSLGSAITYARRYGLMAALGIAAEDDDDAQTQAARSTINRPANTDGPWRWTSGKYEGKTLAETPLSYIKWYAENGPKEDARVMCVQQLVTVDPVEEDIPF